MKKIELKCPYCKIDLIIKDKEAEKRRVSIRCKYCYGIFSFYPYEHRVSFKKNRNFYEIYGLKQKADLESINHRYRELALKFHPDRQKDKEFANEKMKQINYIHNVLSGIFSRREYDNNLGFNEEFEDLWSEYEPPPYIYKDDINIKDSTGRISLIKESDYIYFPIEQVFKLFKKRIKIPIKDYMGLKVQRIFNPKYKDKYEEALGKKLEREPLFIVNFGSEEMFIFKGDFRENWLSQKSLNRRDSITVMVWTLIIMILSIIGINHLYNTYTLVTDADGMPQVIRKDSKQLYNYGY